jgi:hypothetical protein
MQRGWAQEIEIYDMRQYVHMAGSPLRAADIYSIAFEPFPAGNLLVTNTFANSVCLQITDPKMEDQGWRDVFMNSCDWCKLCVCLCVFVCMHCIMQSPSPCTVVRACTENNTVYLRW